MTSLTRPLRTGTPPDGAASPLRPADAANSSTGDTRSPSPSGRDAMRHVSVPLPPSPSPLPSPSAATACRALPAPAPRRAALPGTHSDLTPLALPPLVLQGSPPTPDAFSRTSGAAPGLQRLRNFAPAGDTGRKELPMSQALLSRFLFYHSSQLHLTI